MKKVLCSFLPILAIALLLAMVSGAAFAQSPPATGEDQGEFFTTNYFANNTVTGAPDATLRYTEHYGGVLASGVDLCANIYVFAADQQPTECCSCPVTPNGLVTASVRKITSNPETGVVPPDVVIQIISSLSSKGCDPTFGATVTFPPLVINFPSAPPYPEVDSWMTHIQNKVGAAYPITETEGVEELLTIGEFDDLAVDCAFLREFGSGHGDCTQWCGTEN